MWAAAIGYYNIIGVHMHKVIIHYTTKGKKLGRVESLNKVRRVVSEAKNRADVLCWKYSEASFAQTFDEPG